MKKFIVLMTTIFFSSSLYCLEPGLPSVVDYGKLKGSCDLSGGIENWKCGFLSFNNAPEVISTILYLKNHYPIDCVVETGTFCGNTTILFAQLFNEVHTVEIVEERYDATKKMLNNYPQITCHLGSSDRILEFLLPKLKDKFILFYLDAHWQEHWPLLNELKAIGNTHKDRCIIIVDDVKVPKRPDIDYDHYGSNECSLRYMKKLLPKIYRKYSTHYIIPNKVGSRAKLVILPSS